MDQTCPLCNGKLVPWMSMPIDPKKETPCDFGQLFRCSDCSFGMVLPRPTPGEIGTFYDLQDYYTQGRSHFAEGGGQTLADRIRLHLSWRMDLGEELSPEMVDRLLRHQPSDVCDIGCGAGGLALGLSRLGHRVAGVEVDKKALRMAEERGVEVHEGSAEHLPATVSSRQFDLVIMSHVLEHVLEPVLAVQTAKGLLRRGGQFICVVPNNASAGLVHARQAWEPLDVPRHLNFFVPANLRTVCEKAGLQPRRLFFGGYCRQFTNEWINTERRIYDAIVRQSAGPLPHLRQNSRFRAWRLLARSAFAKKATKYDQVGVIAEA
jgi:2-polyprenyl-3-methyl-5-hydroxy-6-metoxy-1,4-benzoquinol methylase